MRIRISVAFAASVFASLVCVTALAHDDKPKHTFSIGEKDFLFDNKPFVIRSGEMHAARIPREYWRHRLEMVRAMGCNTVCAYLFWNQHEPQPGQFDFSGTADAAEYCRIAQSVGLHVILRPGPYSCAEWEFGGFPWWLLKTPDIKLRTRDATYLDAARRYLTRVGKELVPLQITHGGPIIMVQVENEYGSYGSDKKYVSIVRDTLRDAGFDVPMFVCDGASQLNNDAPDDIFCVANFGSDPAGNFKTLREFRKTGPLMCGEFYPGWFDSWGKPHHTGDVKRVVADLSYMLEHRQSFSIYMVHGGTSFGFSCGANSPPFRPQSTSYDYDAPIDEAGRATPKFEAMRALFAKHLNDGEVLPDAPAPNPTVRIAEMRLTECSPLLEKLGRPQGSDRLLTFEARDLPQGMMLYRTTAPPGEAWTLTIRDVHDIATVYLDDARIGTLDRRFGRNSLMIPKRERPARLDILVEAMGRVNYGGDIHDHKGITERVEWTIGGETKAQTGWDHFNIPLDAAFLAAREYKAVTAPLGRPALYRGTFDQSRIGDTFLDMSKWSRGMVWVNGHNLGRYWHIGPQQTLYLPGCWLKTGRNDIVVLDATGDVKQLTLSGLEAPILNEVTPDPLAPSKSRKAGQSLKLVGVTPIATGDFAAGHEWQSIKFTATNARYVCLEALSSHNKDEFTTCAELQLVGEDGKDLPRDAWTIVYADSEEIDGDDGAAANVLDNQPTTFWHTEWQDAKPKHPHAIVIDLGKSQRIAGLRYLPRQNSPNGRIKGYRVYVSVGKFEGI